LNTERSWQVPEIVFIGNEDEGKSSTFEAILGHKLEGYILLSIEL
jgi:hypothetical protein